MATETARTAARTAVARRRDRNTIRVAWLLLHDHTRPQVADHLGLHPNTVAHMARAAGFGRAPQQKEEM